MFSNMQISIQIRRPQLEVFGEREGGASNKRDQVTVFAKPDHIGGGSWWQKLRSERTCSDSRRNESSGERYNGSRSPSGSSGSDESTKDQKDEYDRVEEDASHEKFVNEEDSTSDESSGEYSVQSEEDEESDNEEDSEAWKNPKIS